jgi:hypothetical protein
MSPNRGTSIHLSVTSRLKESDESHSELQALRFVVKDGGQFPPRNRLGAPVALLERGDDYAITDLLATAAIGHVL